MNNPANSADKSSGSPWQFLDQHIQTLNAKLFSGLSPTSLAMAQMDWILNLMQTPSAQIQLQADVAKNWGDWVLNSLQLKTEEESSTSNNKDTRFAHPAWHKQPWASLVQAQHLNEKWWHQAMQLRGMRPHSKEQMGFYASKWLDMVSPSNWLSTNPEAMEKAMNTGGFSLTRGARHALDDWWQEHGSQTITPPETSHQPGQGLAVTAGEVVARSHLCELIQYAPVTPKVHAEPVLIIPSCIMKYYILDLSPHNSMVKWLVSQGHRVYMVSWRNPDENDALLTMDDYVREGVLASLEHVKHAHQENVHLMGYCLGGTFAAIAAAHLEGQARGQRTNGLASLTLLAAETDFSEPGEMGVLIDEAQVRMLEGMMAAQGFLSGKQMAGSFQFLHSRDLVWSNRTKRWLLGDEDIPNDLMIWNADLTRLPAVMHSQYLRQCFLHNDLAKGNFRLDGDTLALHDIEAPVFAVGTVKDHVSPWRSVYKLHHLVSGPVTFALTNGGHNAGIISEPGHQGRHFQLHTTQAHESSLSSDEWLEQAEPHEGSWWTNWSEWMIAHGSGRLVAARKPPKDSALGAAPGAYVMVRYAD